MGCVMNPKKGNKHAPSEISSGLSTVPILIGVAGEIFEGEISVSTWLANVRSCASCFQGM